MEWVICQKKGTRVVDTKQEAGHPCHDYGIANIIVPLENQWENMMLCFADDVYCAENHTDFDCLMPPSSPLTLLCARLRVIERMVNMNVIYFGICVELFLYKLYEYAFECACHRYPSSVYGPYLTLQTFTCTKNDRMKIVCYSMWTCSSVTCWIHEPRQG